MPKKIQWHENLTTDEKIAMYKTVLNVLERAGGSMEFSDFIRRLCWEIDFSKMGDNQFKKVRFVGHTIFRELIKRNYIRFEPYDTYILKAEEGIYIPAVYVVRI